MVFPVAQNLHTKCVLTKAPPGQRDGLHLSRHISLLLPSSALGHAQPADADPTCLNLMPSKSIECTTANCCVGRGKNQHSRTTDCPSARSPHSISHSTTCLHEGHCLLPIPHEQGGRQERKSLAQRAAQPESKEESQRL